jgi:hypothetical protein
MVKIYMERRLVKGTRNYYVVYCVSQQVLV